MPRQAGFHLGEDYNLVRRRSLSQPISRTDPFLNRAL
jgi:hypothetical protein